MIDQTIEKLLKLALDAGFEQAEAFYSGSESFSVRVLEGQIEDYRVENRAGISLRGQLKGKMGYASSEAMDDAALQEMVDAALENAKLIESPDLAPLHGGGDEPGQYEDGECISHSSAAEKIGMAKQMEQAAKQADPRVLRLESCDIGNDKTTIAIQNTLGLKRGAVSTIGYAVCYPVIGNGDNMISGLAYKAFKDFKELDVSALAKEAVEEGTRFIGAASMESGRMPVVFRHDMMAILLSTFAGIFSADAADKGLSLLKGREGEMIAAPCVTILDDPFCEMAYSGLAFDGEGVATYKKAVVENGRFHTLLYDLKSAKKAGVRPTGNGGRRSYRQGVSIAPSNFYLQKGDADLDALLAAAGSGVMITELMGLHSGASAVSGDFSLAARGFLIEDGRLSRPVEQITVAGNFYEMLKDVQMVADDLWFDLPGLSCYGSPSVLIKALSIAGQ